MSCQQTIYPNGGSRVLLDDTVRTADENGDGQANDYFIPMAEDSTPIGLSQTTEKVRYAPNKRNLTEEHGVKAGNYRFRVKSYSGPTPNVKNYIDIQYRSAESTAQDPGNSSYPRSPVDFDPTKYDNPNDPNYDEDIKDLIADPFSGKVIAEWTSIYDNPDSIQHCVEFMDPILSGDFTCPVDTVRQQTSCCRKVYMTDGGFGGVRRGETSRSIDEEGALGAANNVLVGNPCNLETEYFTSPGAICAITDSEAGSLKDRNRTANRLDSNFTLDQIAQGDREPQTNMLFTDSGKRCWVWSSIVRSHFEPISNHQTNSGQAQNLERELYRVQCETNVYDSSGCPTNPFARPILTGLCCQRKTGG